MGYKRKPHRSIKRLQLVEEKRYVKGRELLMGIVSMLVKIAQKQY